MRRRNDPSVRTTIWTVLSQVRTVCAAVAVVALAANLLFPSRPYNRLGAVVLLLYLVGFVVTGYLRGRDSGA